MSNHASTLLFLKHRCCASSWYSRLRNGRPLLLSTNRQSLKIVKYLTSSPAYRPHNRIEYTAERQDGSGRAASRLDCNSNASLSSKIDVLLRLECDFSPAVASYQKSLEHKNTDRLTTTENAYKAIAVTLRRLVLGWSDLSLCLHTEDRIQGQAPAQRAEHYLRQFEDIRFTRSQLYDSRDETEKKNSTFFDKLKSVFAGPTDNRDPQEQEVHPKAHRLREYSADALMYYSVMKSVFHWHYFSHFPSPGQEKLRNDSFHEDTRKKKSWNETNQDIDDEVFSRTDNTTAKESTRHKRAQDAVHHIMLIRSEMMRFHEAGNVFANLNIFVDSLIMKMCALTGSYRYVELADRLLHQHVLKTRPNNNTLTSFYPQNRNLASLSSFHLVLRACESAAQLDQKEGKKKAVSKATMLLLKLESAHRQWKKTNNLNFNRDNQSDEKLSKMKLNSLTESQNTLRPVILTYKLTISTLICAGHETIPDLCKKIDNILFRMMGNKDFADWMSGHTKDDGYDKRERHIGVKNSFDTTTESLPMVSKYRLEPDMLLLHYVLVAYASSNSPLYLNRAKRLLRLMTERRLLTMRQKGERPNNNNNNKPSLLGSDRNHNLLSHSSQNHEWHYPSTSTYNAIIEGILNASFNVVPSDVAINSKFKFVEEDAVYATNLLDDMMSHNTSFPDKTTFDNLLRIWSNSLSKQSGEQAEKVLSRMKGHFACMSDNEDEAPKPNWTTYRVALKCWATSAFAHEPGAAQRALMLLNEIEAQCSSWNKNNNEMTSSLNDSQVHLNHRVFTEVIVVCFRTRSDVDKPDALRIAFDVYNRMIEDNIPVTSKTFACLLGCCRRLLEPGKRMELCKTVFDAACTQGRVNQRVLDKLREASPQLYKEYRSHPSHSSGNPHKS